MNNVCELSFETEIYFQSFSLRNQNNFITIWNFNISLWFYRTKEQEWNSGRKLVGQKEKLLRFIVAVLDTLFSIHVWARRIPKSSRQLFDAILNNERIENDSA